jgi:hypothetical protein
MHLYWDRDKNTNTWFARPNDKPDDQKKKWEASRAIHSTQECPLCTTDASTSLETTMIYHKPDENKKEMHHHVYLNCPKTADLRKERDKAVIEIIHKHTPNLKIPLEDVPRWFSNEDHPAQGQSKATRDLKTYCPKMGSLGFCPKSLPQALRDIGTPKHKIQDCLEDVLLAIAESASNMWLTRRKTLNSLRKSWYQGNIT